MWRGKPFNLIVIAPLFWCKRSWSSFSFYLRNFLLTHLTQDLMSYILFSLETSAMEVMQLRVPTRRLICGSVKRNWCNGSQRKRAGSTSRSEQNSSSMLSSSSYSVSCGFWCMLTFLVWLWFVLTHRLLYLLMILLLNWLELMLSSFYQQNAHWIITNRL